MQAHKVKPVLCFEWLIIELGREAFLSPRDFLLQVIVICYYYFVFFENFRKYFLHEIRCRKAYTKCPSSMI